MNRIAVALALTLLAACSKGTYEPVMDLKADKNPSEAQVDWQQCEWLIAKYGLEDAATTTCLQGRGHSVLGVVYR